MWSALIPAALGAYEGERKHRAHQADVATEAEKDRWSHWTKLKGNVTTEDGDWLGGAVKGGLAGYLGQIDQSKNEARVAADADEANLTEDAGDEGGPIKLDASGKGPMSKELKGYRASKDVKDFGDYVDKRNK